MGWLNYKITIIGGGYTCLPAWLVSYLTATLCGRYLTRVWQAVYSIQWGIGYKENLTWWWMWPHTGQVGKYITFETWVTAYGRFSSSTLGHAWHCVLFVRSESSYERRRHNESSWVSTEAKIKMIIHSTATTELPPIEYFWPVSCCYYFIL